jgi:flagellar export protein FliJ
MKAFRFPFERIREWRGQQLEIEEARLQRLFAERNALRARRAELDRQRLAEEQALRAPAVAQAEELAALDAFARYVIAEKKRLGEAEAECERRIEAQQAAVLEARRRVELLDRLKEKQLSEWRREFDREQENLAGELFLAKWRPLQAAVQPPSMDRICPWAKPASSEHR